MAKGSLETLRTGHLRSETTVLSGTLVPKAAENQRKYRWCG